MLAESKDDDLLAFHSVRLFAGLCVAEIRALDWRDVDLAGGFIHVGAKISKTRSRRLVPILDNLKAWLQPIAKAAARAGDSDWPSKTDPDLRVLAGRRGGRWLWPADSIVADGGGFRSSSANLRSSRRLAALPNHRCGEACDKRQVEGFVSNLDLSD